MIHSILADKATRLYIILGAVFVANAQVAETIGVKLIQPGSALGRSKAGDCRPRIGATELMRERL